jgi:AcrR family transcriptional regulator
MATDMDRREALLDAAAQEFGNKGFAGSRVDAIARRAGVNKQLIFYYFGTKRGLFDAMVERGSPPQRSQTTTSAPATEQLRTAVSSMLHWLDANPTARCALFDPATDPKAATDLLAAIERPVRTAISAGQGLGYFRDSADPDRVARQAVVLCAGWHAMNGAAGPRDAWLDGAVDTLLRTLAW